MSAKGILGGVIIVVTIVVVIIIHYATYKPPPPTTNNSNSNSNSSNSGINTDALILIQEFYINPGDTIVTGRIDYKFELRTEGHAVNLSFSGENGTWLKPVSYPKEGDFNMPSDAKPGSVKVTTGKGETQKFRVELFKVAKVKI